MPLLSIAGEHIVIKQGQDPIENLRTYIYLW